MHNIYETLRRLRLATGLSQTAAAERLTAAGVPTSNKSVSRWEMGASQPTTEQFLALCELYGVRDVSAAFGGAARLNAQGLARLAEYSGYLFGDPKYVERQLRLVRLYDLPASAGTGSYVDSDDYEEVELPADEVPSGTDYAVRVTGDSMEPRFRDGQVVFVRAQETLEVGEVGIFSLNSDMYIKQLGGGQLVSLNAAYAPIAVGEYDTLHVFGRVLG
ncbi:MAG: XRE family transcriptional regulator [Oscillospiraceae bacterium]|jgi:phage repressor protein C with HTH and peptisase S24 domain|nr:XRE family transcriptional regulator [Oscillospiraceae bacterium]